MDIDLLKAKLNEIGWDEHINFELSERYSEKSNDETIVEGKLRELGQQITSTMLDKLEQADGYIIWSLRLSPFVPSDEPKHRAQRFVHHENSQVRYWANKLLAKE